MGPDRFADHDLTHDVYPSRWSARRRAGTGRPLLVADEAAADDQPLDLARALVQPEQPDLAVDPLDRDLPHVPAAAVHLHREVGHPAGHLGAEELGRRRRDPPVGAAVLAAAASRTSARPAATPVYWSASIACTSWCSPMGIPPCVLVAA